MLDKEHFKLLKEEFDISIAKLEQNVIGRMERSKTQML